MTGQRRNELPLIVGGLLLISAVLFALQILLFHDQRATGFYLLQDLAYLPLQALLATFVINELFKQRERQAWRRRVNVVIGSFMAEAGMPLLGYLRAFDRNRVALQSGLRIDARWRAPEYAEALRLVQRHRFAVDLGEGDLGALQRFLAEKREALLHLLQNPSLSEHESFTDMLLAVTHLADELHFRRDTGDLGTADRRHLEADLERGYSLLVPEWLAYLRHLRTAYPFIYSLVLRTNPFDETASVAVHE
jgi:hypothetical protein